MISANQHATSAIILAGGRGTRLGLLTSAVPKPMLPVAGRPFLEYVIKNLVRNGVTDIIVSTGYLGDAIRDGIGSGERLGARISYVREDEPLGTGGASRLACAGLGEPFLILNGDTLLDFNFSFLSEVFLSSRGCLGAMVLRNVADSGRYGSVEFRNRAVLGFREKNSTGTGLVNGGVYLLAPEALCRLPQGPSSLEHDLFPILAAEASLAGVVCDGFFIDIGIPESYALAQHAVPAWLEAISKTR